MSTPTSIPVPKSSGLTGVETLTSTNVKCDNCGRRAFEYVNDGRVMSLGVERCCTRIWNYLRPDADRSIPAIGAMYDKMPYCPMLTRD